MTQAEIAALPDAELVRSVAERVMGHKVFREPKNTYCRFDSSIIHEGGYTAIAGCEDDFVRLWSGEQSFAWKPLTDWNHTMQVVAAMRAKGFALSLNGSVEEVKDFVWFYGPETETESEAAYEYGKEQRAILEAALMAAGATDEPA